MPARVVVAMSGGVDSSTAAALLRAEGLHVVGVTLRLYDATGTAASLGGRCCGPRDIEDARASAAVLGIPHYVVDHTEGFSKNVIDDFVAEHRAGRTPNPCVRCNEHVKFGPLLAFSRAVGAEALATGHYARLDGSTVMRARDRDKDQSYFLFGVPGSVLAQVRFPLGALDKDEVRAIARAHRLPNADKPDSQQICFVPDGDHKAFVEARGGAGRPGRWVDADGRPLGTHEGTHKFTVGQRKGVPPTFDKGGTAPRFVLRVDASSGDVVVGAREGLLRDALLVEDIRWAAGGAPSTPLRCAVQMRHRAAARPGWLESLGERSARFRFDEPVEAGAPGQAAVFYEDEAVIGGGWIGEAPPSDLTNVPTRGSLQS